MDDLLQIEYPDRVIAIKEIKTASDITDSFVSAMKAAVETLDSDLLVETSDEEGIARREKILGISPSDTDTLDDRRYAVLVKWYDDGVYTEQRLRERLNRLVSADMYTLTIDTQNQLLTLKISLKSKAMIDTIKDMIESIVPLHVKLDISLLYNSWTMISGMTWTALSANTWQHWREDVLE